MILIYGCTVELTSNLSWYNVFKWPLFIYFQSFSNKHYNISKLKMSIQYTSIQGWFSNPQRSDQESPPITTRPGLPPRVSMMLGISKFTIVESLCQRPLELLLSRGHQIQWKRICVKICTFSWKYKLFKRNSIWIAFKVFFFQWQKYVYWPRALSIVKY